jgi:hypothetical protein
MLLLLASFVVCSFKEKTEKIIAELNTKCRFFFIKQIFNCESVGLI